MKTSPTQVPRKRTAIYIKLVCDECEKEFDRIESRVKVGMKIGQKSSFCSKPCRIRNWRKNNGNNGMGDHGTLAGYFHCPKPRCRPCLDAMRDYKRSRRKLNIPSCNKLSLK